MTARRTDAELALKLEEDQHRLTEAEIKKDKRTLKVLGPSDFLRQRILLSNFRDFGRLFLGCIEADFCNEILRPQHSLDLQGYHRSKLDL